MVFRTILILAILFAIDFYVFQGCRFLMRNYSPAVFKWFAFAYWTVTALCFMVIISGMFVDWHDWPKPLRTYSFAMIFVTYFSKLFLVAFLIFDDLVRVVRWVAQKFGTTETGQNPSEPSSGISRSDFLIRMGAIIASIPFLALVLGMIRGKYAYQTRRIAFKVDHLPDVFKGFRIVQLSDIHTGSFMYRDPLEKAVRIVNELKPDVIFFTGDLVNDLHPELLPFKDILSGLKAKHGVMSILGNHDYGDYYRWPDKESKEKNLASLINAHREMGWDILLDEHRYIEKEGHRITVVGVQNWSARMNFARYGSLSKALEGVQFNPLNILLSHDPSHWRAEVLNQVNDIHLTLSGHTHGFQFGVDIPGFKWSPVQYMYKEWADLYSENGQHLYVNRGLGFIGYPGRVGVLPEITVFDLEKS
jgi:predicted MPP superfamily phosphohydrolase